MAQLGSGQARPDRAGLATAVLTADQSVEIGMIQPAQGAAQQGQPADPVSGIEQGAAQAEQILNGSTSRQRIDVAGLPGTARPVTGQPTGIVEASITAL